MPVKKDKLLQEVVERGFPELLPHDLQISYESLKDTYEAYGRLEGGGWYIELDRTLIGAPDRAKKGAIAHTLVHITDEMKLSGRESFFDRLLYKFSGRYTILDERNTDINVLIRGFSEELLALGEYLESKNYNLGEETGITPSELRKILKIQVKRE
jgi:hypothetical protein